MEEVMEQLLVDDVVRLRQDIPELALSRGDRGVVRSTWFAPLTRYEVEFDCPNQCSNTRALLRAEQMDIESHAGLIAAATPV
jgi:hypothetical protein